MRTTVRFWRWRRNTLRRRSDRAEAWVVLVAAVLLCLGAPAAGAVGGLLMAGDAPRAAAGWHQVDAVLLHRSPAAPMTGWGALGSDSVRVAAEVRWTPPGGSPRTGEALVPPSTPAGQQVRIWLDPKGVPQADPTDPTQAQARAVVFGVVTGTATALLVLGGRTAAVAVLNRRRFAALDREWAQVGPTWGHHPA
ncbi:hypothetical protein VSR01_36110 [Actinacidiphila sp. DG2A-62]|jgi:hypothetical protein|uniref:Rv1733c family protein n=1 Tax=Actinacidiphila sp. DG2A-62 TaxID=3108821 RepID=UPI002DB8448A|nr:hypothetical protein [Actinacidiphila sp. DG2A-62]MEC3998622.1 hypothetical protein [Actinacidiphila sp. DG2A-62]